MVHPADCPRWDYGQHAHASQLIQAAVRKILVQVGSAKGRAPALATDTRPFHRQVFLKLAPPGYEYYAGNYRGSDFRCLKCVRVGVVGDLRVGYSPADVSRGVSRFNVNLRAGIAGLDEAFALPNAKLSPQAKLMYLVTFVSRAFIDFLTIHPYIDGNGHIARLIVWALLTRYDYWPNRWPIEPRTQDPEYLNTIRAYRDGKHTGLERYILRCISMPPEDSPTPPHS